MTMGPDPMTRIELRSSRRGTFVLPAVHQRGELVEQVAGVVGAGARLGVVLHREAPAAVGPQAADGAVVEVDVADLDPVADGGGVDGVVVVVRGDLHRTGGLAPDRLVAPVVAEGQLV